MDAARTDLTSDELEALGEQIAEHATHLDAATHRLLADIRAFDAGNGWLRQGARSCAEWLSWRLKWQGNAAREHVRVARSLGSLPRIDDALRRGEVSYCQVRAMTRVATPQNEELLLVDAQHATTPQLERIVRKYAAVQRGAAPTPDEDRERRRITRRDLDDGMVSITATLHAEEAEVVWAALTRIARERECRDARIARERESQQFSRVDALVEMAAQVTRGGRPDRTPTDVVVTVPLDVLAGVPGDDLAAAVTPDGALLSMEAARRLACDAGLVLMVEDADGTCVSVGRKRRTIPAPMKRALLQRDKTCRFPGCCNKVFLDGHHAKHWANGGLTELANLVTLCTFHHRFVHEYGYRVELVAGQEPRFFDRENRLVSEVVARPPMVEDGRAVVMRANAALSITATTGFPRWDGGAANYGWIIDDLCRADRLHDVSTETALDPRADRTHDVSTETPPMYEGRSHR